MKQKVLLIEDSSDTRRFLEVMLSRDFLVLTSDNGQTGVEIAIREKPDLILMDVVMPTLNGYDACKLLKQHPTTQNIPVIFLSSKNTSAEVTYGLSLGADDYLPKPFDHKELLIRVKAKLQRPAHTSEKISLGALLIDPISRTVTYQGIEIALTLTEYDLLKLLATRCGVVVSREEIMRDIWKDSTDKTRDRTIDVHIRSIRKKAPALSPCIKSIYGVGYKYEIES